MVDNKDLREELEDAIKQDSSSGRNVHVFGKRNYVREMLLRDLEEIARRSHETRVIEGDNGYYRPQTRKRVLERGNYRISNIPYIP